MKPTTIACAKNVLPDEPAIMLLKDPDGTVIACPIFKMIYESGQQKTPACEQTGMAHG